MSDVFRTEWVILDDRFQVIKGDQWVRRLSTGHRWTEGPAWFAAGRYLVWSDIPNNRMYRWDETTGVVGVFREPAGYTNGHTVDRSGRLLSCEHGARRVTRTEHDGSITVVADRFEGKRFNSPNDIVQRADGTIWFTDPAYGIDSDYEGYAAPSELGACYVFRVRPATGEVRIAADGFVRPNGLAFSADEQLLYVGDSAAGHMKVFSVTDEGRLAPGTIFATCDNGTFDGFRLDSDGRIWASAGDGVHIFHPDGTLLGKLLLPETASNLVFGGPRNNDLFITATSSVYTLRINTTGARYP